MIKNRNKNVKAESATRRLIALSAALCVFIVVAGVGTAIAFGSMRKIWREQFEVKDTSIDVVITSTGKIVQPEVITYHFGLTNGANLATIPYEELRGSMMKRIPNIRNLKIERRLPRRVTIEVEEREPAVRVAQPKEKSNSGLVADFDGVAFTYYNSDPMPIIREAVGRPTAPGSRLSGNSAAALHLIKFLADAAGVNSPAKAPELSEMRVLEVDTSKPDNLYVTFGDYSTAEIAWAHMGEDSDRSRKSMERQLVHLAKAMAARLTPRSTHWIVTDFGPKGRVYASDPKRAAGR